MAISQLPKIRTAICSQYAVLRRLKSTKVANSHVATAAPPIGNAALAGFGLLSFIESANRHPTIKAVNGKV